MGNIWDIILEHEILKGHVSNKTEYDAHTIDRFIEFMYMSSEICEMLIYSTVQQQKLVRWECPMMGTEPRKTSPLHC